MLDPSAVDAVVRDEIRALLSESGQPTDELSGELSGEQAGELADTHQLHELGLNSLLLARLIIQLEAELGVDPFSAEVTIADARSVGALVAVYQRALCGSAPETTEHNNVA